MVTPESSSTVVQIVTILKTVAMSIQGLPGLLSISYVTIKALASLGSQTYHLSSLGRLDYLVLTAPMLFLSPFLSQTQVLRHAVNNTFFSISVGLIFLCTSAPKLIHHHVLP